MKRNRIVAAIGVTVAAPVLAMAGCGGGDGGGDSAEGDPGTSAERHKKDPAPREPQPNQPKPGGSKADIQAWAVSISSHPAIKEAQAVGNEDYCAMADVSKRILDDVPDPPKAVDAWDDAWEGLTNATEKICASGADPTKLDSSAIDDFQDAVKSFKEFQKQTGLHDSRFGL